MPAATKRFVTVGEIARQTGHDLHKIEYILRTREIEPLGKAGNARVYSADVVEWVADELRRIGEAKQQQALHKPRPEATGQEGGR
jgi:hypothetical protein